MVEHLCVFTDHPDLCSLGVKLKVKLVLWPLGIWQGAAQQLGILTLSIVTSVEPAKHMP